MLVAWAGCVIAKAGYYDRMTTRAFVILILGLFAMFGLHRVMSSGPNLPMEDGQVSASKLPLDEETSKVAYQTATFGLG